MSDRLFSKKSNLLYITVPGIATVFSHTVVFGGIRQQATGNRQQATGDGGGVRHQASDPLVGTSIACPPFPARNAKCKMQSAKCKMSVFLKLPFEKWKKPACRHEKNLPCSQGRGTGLKAGGGVLPSTDTYQTVATTPPPQCAHWGTSPASKGGEHAGGEANASSGHCHKQKHLAVRYSSGSLTSSASPSPASRTCSSMASQTPRRFFQISLFGTRSTFSPRLSRNAVRALS